MLPVSPVMSWITKTLIQGHMLSAVVFNLFILEHVINLFHDLDILKNYTVSFCKLSIYLYFFWCFLLIRPQGAFLAMISCMLLSLYYFIEKSRGVCPVTGGISFDLLIKTMVSALCLCIVSIFPLVLINTL